MNKIELSKGETVAYWNGAEFFESKILGIQVDPIDNTLEYKLSYCTPLSKGKFTVFSTPTNIKQSEYFKRWIKK